MALVVKDRVRETSTTAGTGTLTLAGAVSGFQSFSVIGNGNTTYYSIVDGTNNTWEVGVGTYTSAGTTLSRDVVLESSNGNALVSFAAVSKDVFCTLPAERSSVDFTSTATAGGTTTFTNASTYFQVFTGSSNQTVQLPSTATLSEGWSYHIVNNSTGTLTIQTSTAVSLGTIPPGVTAMPTALTTTGNTATDWEFGYTDFSAITGTGANVLATSPTLVTPALGTPTSGNLSSCTADGTNRVGFLNIPQNAQTTNYTLVLGDSGKHIYMASGQAATTITIPAATSVAFPLGTAVTFVNLSVNAMSIAITTDTMYLSPGGTTGTRTLGQYGTATAVKVSGVSSSGIWVITGANLT